MQEKQEQSPLSGLEIGENIGYIPEALLLFLHNHPISAQMMAAKSFLFSRGNELKFPAPVSSEEEKQDPELADRAFRRRVALHSTSVGVTMNILLLVN